MAVPREQVYLHRQGVLENEATSDRRRKRDGALLERVYPPGSRSPELLLLDVLGLPVLVGPA
jgi:hypothetical protein